MDLLCIFDNINFSSFTEKFSSPDICYEHLANEKWKNGFKCKKCGNSNYCKGSAPFSRRCTRCKKIESATANTPFHHCKIPITEAFKIAYLVCKNPDISTYKISSLTDKRQMTCWRFKKIISNCINNKK